MDAERTGKRGPHQADTPPRVGNYVTARVGNYVTDNPSNLGKYVTADTYHTKAEFFPSMGHDMMLEPGWEKVAERIDTWLTGLNL